MEQLCGGVVAFLHFSLLPSWGGEERRNSSLPSLLATPVFLWKDKTISKKTGKRVATNSNMEHRVDRKHYCLFCGSYQVFHSMWVSAVDEKIMVGSWEETSIQSTTLHPFFSNSPSLATWLILPENLNWFDKYFFCGNNSLIMTFFYNFQFFSNTNDNFLVKANFYWMNERFEERDSVMEGRRERGKLPIMISVSIALPTHQLVRIKIQRFPLGIWIGWDS